MTRRLARHDLAWMAAVIEIKGRIRRYDSNAMRATPQLVIRVHSKQLNVLGRMADLTGIQLRTEEASEIEPSIRRGCNEHCPEAHVHTRVEVPPMGIWAMTGVAAAVLLYNLMPYLTEDPTKLQSFVDDAINQLPAQNRGRHAIVRAVQRLAALGWSVPPEVDAWLKEGVGAP